MPMKTSAPVENAPALIDDRIKELGDWRGKTLAKLREIIHDADPEIVEEWKWGIPVWSHDGLVCTGEVYKAAVKTTFAKGASLKDPSGLFNSSLEGNTRRAIDFKEGEKLNEKALKALIREAVALNLEGKSKAKAKKAVDKKPRIFSMSFGSVYPLYVQKAERKGRTKEEVDEIIRWLTGYKPAQLQRVIDSKVDLEAFFAKAPRMNPNVGLITGIVCGVRVEEIEDPLMQKIRYLDKLIDELARGKKMASILRE